MIQDKIRDRPKSAALFAEAKDYFPGGVNSPVRAFKSVSGPPLFIESGSGSRITDVDGHEYIDFCCSWGPLILGHNIFRLEILFVRPWLRVRALALPID